MLNCFITCLFWRSDAARYIFSNDRKWHLSDFCVDAEELPLTQRTDFSRINYSGGYIKTSGFGFADSAYVSVCFYLVSDGII